MAKEDLLKRLNRLRKFSSGQDLEKFMATEMRQNFKAIEDSFQSLFGEVDPVFFSDDLPSMTIPEPGIPILPQVLTIYQSPDIVVRPDRRYLVMLQPRGDIANDEFGVLGNIAGTAGGAVFVSNNFDRSLMTLLASVQSNAYSVNRTFLLQGNPTSTKMNVILQLGRFVAGAGNVFQMDKMKIIVKEI